MIQKERGRQLRSPQPTTDSTNSTGKPCQGNSTCRTMAAPRLCGRGLTFPSSSLASLPPNEPQSLTAAATLIRAVMTTRSPLLCGNCFDHWNDVVGFWRQCAVRRPCIHEFAALLHCPAPAIGLFSGIANGMRQRHFDHVARKPCQVTSPITEAGTEAVDGDVNTKGLQHTQHGSVRHWPVVPMSRK